MLKIYSMIYNDDDSLRIADNRKIISIVDSVGKKGKSIFVKYLVFKNPDSITKIGYGLSGQLRSAVINGGPKECYIIDLPRTKGNNDRIEELLSVIEEIKNGFVTSPMYGKSSLLLMEPPFVIVFSNDKLPYHMLSKDRWDCYNLIGENEPDLKKVNLKLAKATSKIKKYSAT